MKRITFLLALILSASRLYSQDLHQKYFDLVKKADSLYNAKEYKKSAFTYSEAFDANGRKAIPTDRYNAACSWALAGYPDSAFFHLEHLATKSNYSNYKHLKIDRDLSSLHDDNRWQPLLELVKANKEKAEVNLNKPLVRELDSVFEDDQKYRLEANEYEKKYGWDSKEIRQLWDTINVKDANNLVKVKAILDKYGWLGTDVIGSQGNQTLFLVIQHSDQATQEKYLPMMRDAVKNGKAQGSALALLEDRVALKEGKKQIYGSQIGRNPKTLVYYVRPLEDPDNLDRRRAEVGLPPEADYLTHWQLKWDVEQYKKDLPDIEAAEKGGN